MPDIAIMRKIFNHNFIFLIYIYIIIHVFLMDHRIQDLKGSHPCFFSISNSSIPILLQFFIENVWTQFHLSIFVLIPIIFTPSQQLNRLPRWIEWLSNRKYACMAKIRDCGTRYPRNDSPIKYANSRRIRYSKLPLCHWGKGEWGRAPYLFKSVIRCETVYDSVRWFLRSIFTGICLSGMATGDDNRLKSFLLSERNEFRGKLLMSFAQEFGCRLLMVSPFNAVHRVFQNKWTTRQLLNVEQSYRSVIIILIAKVNQIK